MVVLWFVDHFIFTVILKHALLILAVKARLQEKYPAIPERIITIALDSVDFDEERASQILNITVQEEEKTKAVEPTSVRER